MLRIVRNIDPIDENSKLESGKFESRFFKIWSIRIVYFDNSSVPVKYHDLLCIKNGAETLLVSSIHKLMDIRLTLDVVSFPCC